MFLELWQDWSCDHLDSAQVAEEEGDQGSPALPLASITSTEILP